MTAPRVITRTVGMDDTIRYAHSDRTTTPREIAREVRIAPAAVCNRLENRETVEEILGNPHRRVRYRHEGQVISMEEMAKRADETLSTIRRRLLAGDTVEQAMRKGGDAAVPAVQAVQAAEIIGVCAPDLIVPSPRWDRVYMDLAEFWAGQSKDPSTKVGAVVAGLGDRRLVVTGFNGFPPGIADTDARLNDREMRYLLTIHAERNALDHAWFDTRGATLYSTLCPCPQCAMSIISKRIGRVVCPRPDPVKDQYQRLRLDVALDSLNEAKVLIEWDTRS